MNLRVLLLVGSATLNVALFAAVVLRPSLAPPGIRDFLQRSGTPSASAAARTAEAPAHPAAPAAASAVERERAARASLWASLDSDDLPTLVARLRAAGFSRTLVLAIVNAKLDARFADRMKALNGDTANTPFWKPDPMNSSNSTKYWEEYSQIYRDRSRMLRELLGSDSMAWPGNDPATSQRRQFGSISKDKIDLIQRINDDYAEMMGQVRAAAQGIMLPEDKEKLALLDREKRADLAAILTPAELEEYEMRSSRTMMQLRSAFTLMDASEAEFRAIFKAYQPVAERLYPSSTGPFIFTSSMMDERRALQQQANDGVKAALPPERYADFVRASNNEYQQLYRIAQRENVPTDMMNRAFSLRDDIAAESVRIADDKSLSSEQKRTALQSLAQKGKTQIVGALGQAAGDAYAQSARWLSSIENGAAITFGPDGSPISRYIPPPAPAPKS